jgi:hypothetical protein
MYIDSLSIMLTLEFSLTKSDVLFLHHCEIYIFFKRFFSFPEKHKAYSMYNGVSRKLDIFCPCSSDRSGCSAGFFTESFQAYDQAVAIRKRLLNDL